jgi:hypothetical protein
VLTLDGGILSLLFKRQWKERKKASETLAELAGLFEAQAVAALVWFQDTI